jgi:hypothetical protein
VKVELKVRVRDGALNVPPFIVKLEKLTVPAGVLNVPPSRTKPWKLRVPLPGVKVPSVCVNVLLNVKFPLPNVTFAAAEYVKGLLKVKLTGPFVKLVQL